MQKSAYINCDELEKIPPLNKENWLFELDFLKNNLKSKASVLQVGSMDGNRIIHILGVRPALKITGLEIEADFVKMAKEKISKTNLTAKFIHGDITAPQILPKFDYCICLNNTLGYIPDEKAAIRGMKTLGNVVIISVYGEKFNDDLAKKYFKSIRLDIESIVENKIVLKDFGVVKRYTKNEVESWGGKIIESPVGYIVIIG